MIKDFEQIQVSTICPICNRNISEVWIAKLDSVIGVRYAYICCECENLLKISKEKISDIKSISNYNFSSTFAPEKTNA